jgi:hypothetical protein
VGIGETRLGATHAWRIHADAPVNAAIPLPQWAVAMSERALAADLHQTADLSELGGEDAVVMEKVRPHV